MPGQCENKFFVRDLKYIAGAKPLESLFMTTQRLRFPYLVFLLVLAALGYLGGTLSAQTVPPVVFTSPQTLVNISGNSGHVAVNSLGDAFYVSQSTSTLYRLPAGSTTPIALVTGLSGGRSVSVDSNNNVYAPSNYSGYIVQVPYVGGSYAAGTAVSSITAACTVPATAPCRALSSGAGTTGYYLQSADVAFDASGNAYVVDERDNVCNQSSSATTCNRLLKFAFSNGAYATTATLLADNLPQNNSGQIAADPSGNVYYADGQHVYKVAAGATSATIIGTGLSAPGGVATDRYGNLFISDTGNSRIVEMPALNGVAQTGSQFTVAYLYSANGAGIARDGRIFYTSYANNSTNLSVATLWGYNLGTSAIGTANSAVTITATFTGSVTLSSVALSAGSASDFALTGGTCATGTAYSAGNSCTLIATFTPTAVGLRRGGVVLTSSTGTQAGVAYLYGVGQGAAQTVDPGTTVAIGSAWTTPQAVAIDNAGNTYVVDPGANAVKRFAAGSTTTSTTVGTGLNGPTGVAVDGAGNVFIADAGNTRVIEVPLSAGAPSNAQQSVIYSGTSGAAGLAFDGVGNLYIADSGHSRVIRLSNTGGIPNANQIATIGSGFTAPVAVAVDSSGNVFVADKSGNKVTEVQALTGTLVNIGSSLSSPAGVAVDASGSVYIADTGNLRITKIPYESGAYNSNDQYSVGAGIAAPYGVALDAAGNLYVTDSAHASVTQFIRTSGTLALGRANLGTTTSQLSSRIGNAGNQSLTFGSPLYTQTGTPAPFNITSPSTNGCAASTSLATGYACQLAVTFSPTATGDYSDVLTFNANAANTSTPRLTLTGKGTYLAPTTTVLAKTSPAGTPALGQAVTVTANVAYTAGGSTVPTGSVTFYLDGATNATVALSSTGQAAVTFNTLSGGQHTVGASYTGDDNSASSAASTINFTVAQASSSTVLTIVSPNTQPQSGPPGSSVTFNAVVTANGAPSPTGTVTFYNGSTALGTGAVAGGAASYTTTTLAVGTYNVTAVYSGDVNYTGSTSSSVPYIVATQQYTITLPSTNLTVITPGSASMNITINSLSGFAGNVGLRCSGLPANSSCSFSPNGFAMAANKPQVVTLTVLVGQVPVIGQPPVTGALRNTAITMACLLLMPLGFIGRKSRRAILQRSSRLLLLFAMLGLVASGLTGCGAQLSGVTPKGTSTITITGSGSIGSGASLTSIPDTTAQFTLTVQ